MKGTLGIIYTREVPFIVMLWIGRHILHQDLQLAIGVNPKGEVMMKTICWTRNLDVFKGLIMIHISRLMLLEIGMLTCIQNLISFKMVMPALITMMIENMISLVGLGDMIGMTMHMMIMVIGLVHPIIIGRIVMIGILIMVVIVTILIMGEVEEIVIGGDADLVTENMIEDIQVGKEI